jgi:DNA invertase Pin-like site-specific DNA recombinase
MKITTKKPLRPRGRNSEKRQETKDSIAEVYAHGPAKPVQIIPATKETEEGATKKKLRVCAYCRVSTEEDNQASSYELQVQNYTKMIKENDAWEFAGIFADEGISGTSMQHREQFLAMIELCKAGQIDLIITKQISRFARNVLDSLNTIFMLRKLDPPVGVFFETEHLNTLDRSSDMVVTVLSLVAQSESEQKSYSLKWSFKRRRAQGLGIYPNWALLGYKGHEWEIVEEEADVVRTIYNLYLNGYSSVAIAELLTKSGIPTVKGLTIWSSGAVLGILKNEKYCGDALCQKTVTLDPLTHQCVKNNGIEPQYFIEDHHKPIIEKADWKLVQQIIKEKRYRKRKGQRNRKPEFIVKGPLAGFFIIDPTWDKQDVEDIIARSSNTTQPLSPDNIEEDGDFYIEKE